MINSTPPDRPRRKPRTRPTQLSDREWLRAQYETAGRTTYDIATEVGCSANTVSTALSDAGIELRTRGGGNPIRFPQLRDPAYMVNQLVNRAHTEAQVAGALGCDESTVREAVARPNIAEALDAAGWDMEANALARQRATRAVPPVPQDQLVEYLEEARGTTVTLNVIAERFELTEGQKNRMRRWMRQMDNDGVIVQIGGSRGIAAEYRAA